MRRQVLTTRVSTYSECESPSGSHKSSIPEHCSHRTILPVETEHGFHWAKLLQSLERWPKCQGLQVTQCLDCLRSVVEEVTGSRFRSAKPSFSTAFPYLPFRKSEDNLSCDSQTEPLLHPSTGIRPIPSAIDMSSGCRALTDFASAGQIGQVRSRSFAKVLREALASTSAPSACVKCCQPEAVHVLRPQCSRETLTTMMTSVLGESDVKMGRLRV